ncbi:unnamed protein product, partial [Dibothriocephalus latus]
MALCKFLSPATFALRDLKLNLDWDPWWPFDSSLLHVSFSLALLWLGLSDEAVDQFIEGSVSLRNCLRPLQPTSSTTAAAQE